MVEVTRSSPLVVIAAYAIIADVFGIQAMVFPTTTRIVSLDSVFASDSACALIRMSMDMPDWGDYYALRYTDDVLRFAPGDTAEIRFYAEGKLSTATVKLLDYYDTVTIVDDATPDSVDVDDPIEIHWHPKIHADWYGFTVTRYLASDLYDFWDQFYYFSYDSTITIPADLIDEDGKLVIDIIAATGPAPSDQAENVADRLLLFISK